MQKRFMKVLVLHWLHIYALPTKSCEVIKCCGMCWLPYNSHMHSKHVKYAMATCKACPWRCTCPAAVYLSEFHVIVQTDIEKVGVHGAVWPNLLAERRA